MPSQRRPRAASEAEATDSERRELQAALTANEHLAGEIAELELRRDTRTGELERLIAELGELALVPGHLESLKQARDEANDGAFESRRDAA